MFIVEHPVLFSIDSTNLFCNLVKCGSQLNKKQPKKNFAFLKMQTYNKMILSFQLNA